MIDPLGHRYDIRLKSDGRPVLFTWYKGHTFDGWISQGNFERAERDGVLSWDAAGNPVIATVPPAPPASGSRRKRSGRGGD